MSKVILIAAIGKNRELGLNNELLWDIPEDMKHFRETTAGHPVIMGRKTYESIGCPLPNRTNIIITRDENYTQEGCISCTSIEQAIEEAKRHDEEIYVIGGAQIYTLTLPFADELNLTLVDKDFEADAFFPEYENDFKEIEKKESSNENFEYAFSRWART